MAPTTRWLFGDQLGPHFLDADEPVMLVESTEVLRRRVFHRQKAHLVLSAMRHRAAELGDRCTYRRTRTYREALPAGDLQVVHPTSWDALGFVRSLERVEVLPARGYALTHDEFRRWAGGRRRLVQEDLYREVRRTHDLLMDGDAPVGGRWNLDHDNREPPPRSGDLGVPEPWWPTEDEIDEEVRHDLDRLERDGVTFLGDDGPRRFAATRSESLQALHHFVGTRLGAFGPYEDAMIAGDPWMAHSLLSAPINLGLLHPVEAARAAEQAWRDGAVPLASAEGFVRQVVGWRDYVWHTYWHEGRGYRHVNRLGADRHLPPWFAELRDDEVDAACLATALRDVREHGWTHHIPRLMVLGSYAMQRGWRPGEVLDWFHRAFVDGFEWVMVPNALGMSQHADGGRMMTKPYTSGGAYLHRMSDHCGGCRYKPTVRLGEDACPFTAGYWTWLSDHADALEGNHRMAQPLAGMRRLADLEAVVEQERTRGSRAP